MPRKTFFSFHYQLDSWRVGQVRNSNLFPLKYEDDIPFYDKADWEQVKRNEGIQHWIDRQLSGTSVTVVLIGAQTYGRPWVNYEISESWNKGNGLLGIYIHNVKDRLGYRSSKGRNPFTGVYFTNRPGQSIGRFVRLYDWVDNDGRTYMGDWIERAYDERQARPIVYPSEPF
jgi:hypothetical protein